MSENEAAEQDFQDPSVAEAEAAVLASLTIQQRIWMFTRSFAGIEKTRTGARESEKYFNIDDVYNAAVPVMTECGIGSYDEVATAVLNGVVHSVLRITVFNLDNPEDKVVSELPLPTDGDMRKYGSAMSYQRRYGLCAMLNIRVPGEDDDHAIATEQPSEKKVSANRLEKIEELISETNTERSDVIEFVGNTYGVTTLEELTFKQAQTLLRMLEKKKGQANGTA